MTHRNFGLAKASGLAVPEQPARSTRDAVHNARVIRFPFHAYSSLPGSGDSPASRPEPFIPAFERPQIIQAAIDCLAVVFGAFFASVFTVSLSAGIYWLLISIVG